MKIGFTGTAKGMTARQMSILDAFLEGVECTEFHHGDCVGSDVQAHAKARQFEIPVVVHPPTDPKARAFKGVSGTAEGNKGVTVLPVKTYLRRNHDIVDATDVLIATPKEYREPGRMRAGGTWATIRYARKQGRAIVLVIWP